MKTLPDDKKFPGLPNLEVKVGDSLVDALVAIGFATSKREAKYLIKSGAVSLIQLREKVDASNKD